MLENKGSESPGSKPAIGVVKDQGSESPGSEPVRREIPDLDRKKKVVVGDPVERSVRPHPLLPSTPPASSSMRSRIHPVLINVPMEFNPPNNSGERMSWLKGLIRPFEREELSAKSETTLANDVLHFTLRVMFSIFYLFALFV